MDIESLHIVLGAIGIMNAGQLFLLVRLTYSIARLDAHTSDHARRLDNLENGGK